MSAPFSSQLQGQALRKRLAIRQAEEAMSWLMQERLFGLVDAADFPSMEASEQARLQQNLQLLRSVSSLRSERMHKDLACAVQLLHAAGVEPIVLKGAALSTLFYQTPGSRPSADIDLLISPNDVDTVHKVLQAEGWTLPSGIRGQWVSGQFSYQAPSAKKNATTLDIHWKLTNRAALNHVLSYSEIRAQAVENTDSAVKGHIISPVHALVHAIVHLSAHHARDPIAALWWLDLALLDAHLSPSERREALRILQKSDLLPLAAEAWRGAAAAIGFVPSEESAFLLDMPKEAPAYGLSSNSRGMEIWRDLEALSPLHKLYYLRELLFPDEPSIRAAFQEEGINTALWRLYLLRFVRRGVRKSKTKDERKD